MNRKIGLGVLWNLANVFLSRGASVVFTLFLAQLLAPEAFGLIAMVMVVFELADSFVQSGLGLALIRSKQVTQADLSTVFFSNLGLSLLAYGAMFLAAPAVAGFYSQPELTLLVQVLGLVVFFNGARVVQVAVLSRAMNFRAQMQANTLGVLVSGTAAVTAAWLGLGVWALVVQMLTNAMVTASVMWLVSGWWPSLAFSMESCRRLFRFGFNLLVEGMLAVLYQNSHVLVIGRFFSAEVTGLYFLARKITHMLSLQLSGAVVQASYPALATLQEDTARLRHKYRQIVQLMMFLMAPLMLVLAALASPLFAVLFDERWQASVPFLQLLCLVGLLFPLHALNVSILNVKGRSDLVLKIGLVKKAINLTLLFAALPFGVLAIAASQVVGSCLALAPNTWFTARLLDYGFRDQLLDTCRPMLAGGLAAAGAWAVAVSLGPPSPWLLAAAAMAAGLIYLVASLLLRAGGLMLLLGRVRHRWYARRKATA